jgi:hypothetical protein
LEISRRNKGVSGPEKPGTRMRNELSNSINNHANPSGKENIIWRITNSPATLDAPLLNGSPDERG